VAQRVGRDIALLFHDGGTRGEWSAARPGRTLPPGKTRYPFYRRLGGTQGRSGRAENLVPTGIFFSSSSYMRVEFGFSFTMAIQIPVTAKVWQVWNCTNLISIRNTEYSPVCSHRCNSLSPAIMTYCNISCKLKAIYFNSIVNYRKHTLQKWPIRRMSTEISTLYPNTTYIQPY